MTGKEDRGTVLSGTGVVVTAVVVLTVAGGITSATAVGISPATDDYRSADAAVDSVVETAMLGTTGVLGAPPGNSGNAKGNGNGMKAGGGNANGDGDGAKASRNRGGGGASEVRDSSADGEEEASDGSESAAGNDGSKGSSDGGAADGPDATGDAPGKSEDAPGNSAKTDGDGDAPGKSEDAPGKSENATDERGTANGRSAENRTADGRRGPPETVPAAVNVSTRGAKKGRPETVVNASVGDVRADQRARIGLEARRDALVNRSNASDVAFTAMELTPARNGSFTLNVTAADRINGSPAFESDDGTEAMTHIRVDHSISNDELNGTVGIDFRVSKERLANESVAPEDVALYRYENGSWTELPTTPVNETETAVLFRAESPGLSEFAAGAKRARFTLQTVDVAVEEIAVGDDLRVHVGIENDGGADGEFAAQLLLDGDVVEERSLTIAAGGERQTLFDHRVNASGRYEVRVNDVLAGEVVVRESVDAESTATRTDGPTAADSAAATDVSTDASAEPSTTVSGTEVPEPIFHPTALVFVVVAALIVRVRRRR